MTRLAFILLLLFAALPAPLPAGAVEIEDRRSYPAVEEGAGALHIIGTTEAEVMEDLGQYVSQAQQEQSALGDELGEAFDMDMGVGI